jgi:hypothetical protein
VKLLTPEQAAERYSLSKFEIYERTRLNQLPLVVHPGKRRVFLPEEWLDEFDAGAFELEVRLLKTAHGIGRVVRPKGTQHPR